VPRTTSFAVPTGPEGERPPIQRIYAALAADPVRNGLIFDDVLQALEEKRSPVVLTERKDHAIHLASRLSGFARNVVVLTGGMGVKERRAVMQRLESIPATEERVLIATGRYLGEGFDDSRLDTLFLAMPISWKGTLAQYVGRLHRLHPGKREAVVYDYIDEAVPLLKRMSEKRMRGYKSLGYSIDVARAA
jgi:superfamily II DNA or RNA helicase